MLPDAIDLMGGALMGFALLILGLALFLGVHVVTTRRALRASLIARLGEGGYKILYSVIALVGLALVVKGYSVYRATEWIDIWYPPKGMRHLVLALMLPAVILVVAAYIRGRIYTRLKHPMLAGVKLWAVAHLLANGDLGSIILFGSVLAWAVYDRISLKHRADAGAPPIPVGGVGNDLIAIGVGVVAYLALAFSFHPLVIGVPVVGV
ncbi:NnrU protein [Afipia carboxidovorans OM5]|uniref:NnrU domain protein n=2 Tax=Afipia carboxidovorans TaxID=40137 RepID=B6JGY1_AFIC5|nr:NnrU protein [Afipia carboxidovorans OM5]AEI02795.1 NnrU domain protein [Afipia carboxidovorans OM4]AEI06371.1 NnrU domain protein [Afipia carboxidovorans OM5]BEV47168.1 NnrU family protein [Afipia carboxidovorans]